MPPRESPQHVGLNKCRISPLLSNVHQLNAHQLNAHQLNAHRLNVHRLNGHRLNVHQLNVHQLNVHQLDLTGLATQHENACPHPAQPPVTPQS